MSELCDVIIVGVGLAGSYAAYELASSGYSVAVLEQKDTAGLDFCCTGIISTECFDSFDISSKVILTRANSAKLFSPMEHFIVGPQAVTESTDVDEVEIYLSQRTAPGFFAWLVTALPNKTLVGLIKPSHVETYL